MSLSSTHILSLALSLSLNIIEFGWSVFLFTWSQLQFFNSIKFINTPERCHTGLVAVYFDQQTGTLHTNSRSKSSFSECFNIFHPQRKNKTGLQPVSRPMEKIIGFFPIISTSQQYGKHLFACQNTQYLSKLQV